MIGRRDPNVHLQNNGRNYVQIEQGERESRNPDNMGTNTNGAFGLLTNIRLPPLHIKPFTGDKLEWPEYKVSCESAFHSISNEATRFQYLKGHLRDEPARLIRHLPVIG